MAVTRRYLDDAGTRLEGHVHDSEARLRRGLHELELRITVRFGGMLAGSTALVVAILGALITFK